jgi:hypothetical protein
MENPKPSRKPRREVWWLDQDATNHSLTSIGRCFDDRLNRSLLSSSNSLLRHIRSPKYYNLRRNLHQCPGYLREEITLTCDLSRSVIVSHAFPGQSERCSICHQLVQYTHSESPDYNTISDYQLTPNNRLSPGEAEQEARERAEQERLAAEAAERLAKEEAKHEAKEREEQERLAAEATERLAEAARLQKEQEAKEKSEKEKLEKERAEHGRLEQERLAQEEKEKAAAAPVSTFRSDPQALFSGGLFPLSSLNPPDKPWMSDTGGGNNIWGTDTGWGPTTKKKSKLGAKSSASSSPLDAGVFRETTATATTPLPEQLSSSQVAEGWLSFSTTAPNLGFGFSDPKSKSRPTFPVPDTGGGDDWGTGTVWVSTTKKKKSKLRAKNSASGSPLDAGVFGETTATATTPLPEELSSSQVAEGWLSFSTTAPNLGSGFNDPKSKSRPTSPVPDTGGGDDWGTGTGWGSTTKKKKSELLERERLAQEEKGKAAAAPVSTFGSDPPALFSGGLFPLSSLDPPDKPWMSDTGGGNDIWGTDTGWGPTTKKKSKLRANIWSTDIGWGPTTKSKLGPKSSASGSGVFGETTATATTPLPEQLSSSQVAEGWFSTTADNLGFGFNDRKSELRPTPVPDAGGGDDWGTGTVWGSLATAKKKKSELRAKLQSSASQRRDHPAKLRVLV